jgi:predicted acyl esterase
MNRPLSPVRWFALVAVCLCVFVPLFASAQPVAFTDWVQMPDGILLATDVYLPDSSGSWPAVLIRTPYNKTIWSDVGFYFRDHGYAFVAQDMRGFHQSQGTWQFFQGDISDGQATVDWVAQQGWCDGQIGTYGPSADGVLQYLLAPGASSALACLGVELAAGSMYHTWIYQGGALRRLFPSWLVDVGYSGLVDDLLAHRLFDSWWQPLDVVSQAGEVTTPGLHIGGWYDHALKGTLDAFSAFQSQGGIGAVGNQKMIIGPWVHNTNYPNVAGQLVYPNNAAFPAGQRLGVYVEWYDHWLKGLPSGVDDWPAVKAYLMGAVGESGPGNVWVELDGWPPLFEATPWYLSASGGLSNQVPATASTDLTIDPNSPVPTRGGANGIGLKGPYDQRPVESRDDVLTFTTEPLARHLAIMGPITARVWIVPDTLDLDLSVRLSDVYPDGRSMLVTDGILRARKRCGDDIECLLEPGVPVEIEVDLWSTSLIFNAGHSIRVALAGSNSPRFEVNPNHGGDLNGTEPPVVAHPEILFGPEYPSAIFLPVSFLFVDGFESGDCSGWSATVP